MDPLAVEAYEKCIVASLNLHDSEMAARCMRELEEKYREEICEPLPQGIIDHKKVLKSEQDTQLPNVI
jgi:hypothetical protein